MAEGWFTGKRLEQYFNDPKNARQIVNGSDKDKEIAAIHQQFLAAIQASWVAVEPPSGLEDVTISLLIRVPKGAPVTVIGAAVESRSPAGGNV